MLSTILRPDLIKVEMEAESRDEAIRELLDHLVQRHEIRYTLRDHVLECILELEDRHHTGMEQGIAVPHGITDRVEDMICALGTSTRGVPFEARDGGLAHLVILLVVPRRNYVGEVRTLAEIEQLLERSGLKDKIIQEKEPSRIHEFIQQAEKEQAA